MRSVSIAIWTSGEPVSVSLLPNLLRRFLLGFLGEGHRTSSYVTSPSIPATPRKEDAHGRDEVAELG